MATQSIKVGSANWDSKARSLINKKKKFVLILAGIDAGVIWEALKNLTSRNWAQRKLGAKKLPKEPVIIALTIVMCLALGVVAAVCLFGMHKGYNVKVKHRVTGPMIWDHRLDITLVPG